MHLGPPPKSSATSKDIPNLEYKRVTIICQLTSNRPRRMRLLEAALHDPAEQARASGSQSVGKEHRLLGNSM